MKRLPYPVLNHNNRSGKSYWRSLRDREHSPELEEALATELPRGAGSPPDGVSRRDFFRLVGASAALAGIAACRRPEEKILPYTRQPEEMVPGNPLYFATAMAWNGTAIGLVVESHEGRPTKIEGNPRHPESLGALNSWAQSEILNLYDPDRSATPVDNNVETTWDAVSASLAALGKKYQATQGKGLAILTEAHRSPTTAAALARLKAALPQLQVVRYEAFSKDNGRAGAALAFGRPLEQVYDFTRAHTVVALDSDFLMDDGVGGTRNARAFAQARRNTDVRKMNRLYAIESAMTVTGAMADHRLRLPSHEVSLFALTLARECGVANLDNLPKLSPEADKVFRAVAKDLDPNRKVCAIVVGDKQPAAVHAAIHVANALLGATNYWVQPFDPTSPGDGPEQIVALSKQIKAGEITGLLILGGNPVWNAPADADFGNAVAKLDDSVHVSTHRDETSALCKTHLNRAHFLEQWDSVRAVDGTVSIVQPMIAPLFDGKTDAEVLSLLLGDPQHAYDLVRASLQQAFPSPDFEKAWRHALHDGVWLQTLYPQEEVQIAPKPELFAQAKALVATRPVDWEVTFLSDPHVFDGRFANNGWMQELPDPMTKVCWGNVALISPADAEKLGVEDENLVSLTVNGVSKTLPVLVMPGQCEGSIGVTIGQGRKIVGRVGEGVGFPTTALRSSAAFGIAQGAKVEKIDGAYEIARTQEHFQMEGRAPVREGTVSQYKANPEFVKEFMEPFPREANHNPLTLSSVERDYSKGHKWAMTIDLNTCIGCAGCTVACIAENNIPVVGKDGVRRSREMHWIRVDRYFEGKLEAPNSVSQPMTCQQCENAPCEEVCPVGATSHSPEGLNDMAYNRCIGTKYCLNNCPFKVRHFNYFNYVADISELRKAQFNPEVTVRSRGVMEKCTYCVQRINAAKIEGHKAGTERIEDGKIKTACQQACPTDAIIFGDLNDPDSRVAKLKAEPRSYVLLEELNVRPRTTYLARIRNPNPELA